METLSRLTDLHSAFCVDDAQNQPLADWYGIVMGTSHEEPMMRSVPVEWNFFGKGAWDYGSNQQNVYDFWRVGAERARPYEGVITIGMRGNGAWSIRHMGQRELYSLIAGSACRRL